MRCRQLCILCYLPPRQLYSFYEIFDTVMHKNAMKLLLLEADLRLAVKRQEFLLAFLQLNQCDEMQGYLFSPPVPAKEFEKLLEKERCIA